MTRKFKNAMRDMKINLAGSLFNDTEGVNWRVDGVLSGANPDGDQRLLMDLLEAEPETVKLRLTVDVEYKLNGERVMDADFYLHELVQTAVNRGLFTGDSPMEVESYSYNVEHLQ